MDGHPAKTNEKRPNENEDIVPQSPKRNRSASVESVDQQPQPTKIVDLNDDCLDKIFENLDLSSLFNVAVSNECMRIAARIVYRRRFGAKLVNIRIGVPSFTRMPSETEHEIIIGDVRTCLQFLRCFGPSIQNLKVNRSYWNSERCDYIDEYINQYCAETLVTLSFLRNRKFSVENFKKPFVNLESIQIKDADLGDQLPLFVEWFPKLRRLELLDVCVDRKFGKNKATFNHLEQLSIEINNRNSEFGFSKRNVIKFLRLHPQLRSLNIHMPSRQGMPLTTLLSIVRYNPSISTLVLTTCRDYFASYSVCVKTAELMPFTDALPSLEKVALTRLRFTADDAIAFVRPLNSLKQFYFMLEERDEYNYLVEQLTNEWHISDHHPFEFAHSNPNNHHIIALIRKN